MNGVMGSLKLLDKYKIHIFGQMQVQTAELILCQGRTSSSFWMLNNISDFVYSSVG